GGGGVVWGRASGGRGPALGGVGCERGWWAGAARHSPATRVWSGVRAESVALPSALTSLNAAAYSGLVRAGGGGGRNWPLLSTANGVISGTWALAAALESGGVGCHWPGSVFGGV